MDSLKNLNDMTRKELLSQAVMFVWWLVAIYVWKTTELPWPGALLLLIPIFWIFLQIIVTMLMFARMMLRSIFNRKHQN